MRCRCATTATVRSQSRRFRCYVGHDRAQPGDTDAAPFRDCVAVSCGAGSHRDQIVNVGCDKLLELRRVQRLLFLRDRAGIRNKQFNRLRACRNHADQSVVDATGERYSSGPPSFDESCRLLPRGLPRSNFSHQRDARIKS